MAVTDDPVLLDRMILLGHFNRPRLGAAEVVNTIGDMSLGTKYRAHPWAIAMANVGLKRLPELNERRTANYEFLNDQLRDCPGLEVIDPLPGATRGGYLEYKFKLTAEALQVASRERIVAAMAAEGAPVTADRYSDRNYTYGLLHAAPLLMHSAGSEIAEEIINTTRPSHAFCSGIDGLQAERIVGTALVVCPGELRRGDYAVVDTISNKVLFRKLEAGVAATP